MALLIGRYETVRLRLSLGPDFQEEHGQAKAEALVHADPDCDQLAGFLSDRIEQDEKRVIASYARRKREVPAGRYAHANVGNLLNWQELERAILRVFSQRRLDISTCRILDVGCGGGFGLREFIRYGARPERVVGLELLPERVAEAQRMCPQRVSVVQGNAAQMEFLNESFDVVFQSTMFTSVRDAVVRQEIAREMLRVIRPGGFILWYDFFVKDPRNPDVVGIGRKEVRRLFPSYHVSVRRLTLLPPLARRLGTISPFLVRVLASLKCLSTHYLAVIEKR